MCIITRRGFRRPWTQPRRHGNFQNNNLVDQAQDALLGMILFSANRDTEAWTYMEISLTKNLELGNRHERAITLAYMGYGYLRRGEYLNAYGAYEAATESYVGTVNEHPDGTTCKNNMTKIKDMLKNSDLNVGFERPRADINWLSLFIPALLECRIVPVEDVEPVV